MWKTAYRLAANALNVRFRPKALIHPLMVVYHITNLCNLRCFYCEDFSADKNRLYAPSELSTDEVKELLKIIRKKFDYLYLTGGEPYVRRDLEELMEYMKRTIGFHRISLNTNGLTVDQKPEVLKHIRNLVISIDSLNQDHKDLIIGCKKGTSKKIFENLRWAAGLQKKYKFEVSVNCVLAPHTLEDAREVLEYCLREGLKFSCIPQSINYSAHPAFKDNAAYQKLIALILRLKKKTRLISGTRHFFENILNLSPFKCYPHAVPKVAANGDLYWPCRPLNTFAGNLLQIGSYDKTVQEGIRRHGILNACTKNCHLRCYIESSVLVGHPLSLVKEFFSPPDRTGVPPLIGRQEAPEGLESPPTESPFPEGAISIQGS